MAYEHDTGTGTLHWAGGTGSPRSSLGVHKNSARYYNWFIQIQTRIKSEYLLYRYQSSEIAQFGSRCFILLCNCSRAQSRAHMQFSVRAYGKAAAVKVGKVRVDHTR